MREKARVDLLAVALLALFLAGMRAQGTTMRQQPPNAMAPQVTAQATQAKPADVKPAAAQEALPADFTAFNNAGKEKDLQKRVDSYEKFIADHPKSPLVRTARNQIQSTLLATLKTAQAKYLDVIQQQIETAKKDTSPTALSSTYSRLASGLLSAGVMLDQAEEYGRAALSLLEEQKYTQERKQAAERAAEAFAKRTATPPAAAPAPPPGAAAATPPAGAQPAAAPALPPLSPGGGFTISMVDGVPFAKPAAPRPAAAATPPTAPRVPTDDEIRAGFRAERASVQVTLGQILLKRSKTAEGEKILKEAYAARPASGTMATVARVLAGSAKKAGDDPGQLEYLTALALSGRITKEEQQDFEAVYRKTHNGSIDGLEQMLDARYLRDGPKLEVTPSSRAVKPTDRAVLAEMFTGAG